MVNTESYVDRSARRASRNAWKQSQCVASGQTITAKPPNYPFGNTAISQQSLNRSTSGLSYAQQIAQQSAHQQSSAVSISSGSVSSIASSLATSGPSGSQSFILIQIFKKSCFVFASKTFKTHFALLLPFTKLPKANFQLFLPSYSTAPSIGGLSGLGGARPIATARHTIPKL